MIHSKCEVASVCKSAPAKNSVWFDLCHTPCIYTCMHVCMHIYICACIHYIYTHTAEKHAYTRNTSFSRSFPSLHRNLSAPLSHCFSHRHGRRSTSTIRWKFSKVYAIVILFRKDTSAMTFENFWQTMKDVHMRSLFEREPSRFDQFNMQVCMYACMYVYLCVCS